MRKKLSLFLVMIMALTMVLGTGITAMAVDRPSTAPERVNQCTCTGTETEPLWYVMRSDGDNPSNVIVVQYSHDDGSYSTYGEQSMPRSAFMDRDHILVGRVYHRYQGNYCLCDANLPLDPGSNGAESSQAHTHNYQHQVLKAPSVGADGEEAEVCTICGDIRNRQPISAMGYALYDYAVPMINASKPGQTITFEFGELNSFPKSFMEKLVDKSAQNVTFVFKYNWNHELQKVTIPAGTPIDLNFDYYGPAKMAELYGMY